MADVTLPALGESVTDGILTEWLVEVGDTVEVDQPLFEISTDKIDTEVPSPVAGVVQELRAEVDDTIEVGQVVCVIGGEGAAAAPSGGDEPAASGESADQEDAAPTAPEPDTVPAPGDANASSARSDDGGSDGGSDAAPAAAPSAGGNVPADADFDLLIIGAGTGGYSCALRAAHLGLKVGLVEKAKVGGTCLHWGCIPTKAILHSAEVAETVHAAGDFGVSAEFKAIEMTKVIEHQSSVVNLMHKGLQGALKGKGIETIHGHGRITDRNTVEVELNDGGSRTVTTKALVIATGSTPRELPFAPFDGEKIISSDHALFLEKVPAKAIVLGSGAVGMEFATAWNAFGAEVTVVELLDRLLPLEDADISKEIAKQFRKAGIKGMTKTKMTAVETTADGVSCTIENAKGETETLEADILLVAVGRGPVIADTGIEELGVKTDKGFVVVDEYCRTNVPGVFAIGDVIPTLGLAHASFPEGIMVADQLAGLDVMPIDYRGVPKVTYSHPECASVGYTEAEAKEEGFEVVIEKFHFQGLARAQMMKASGLVKIVAAKDDSQPGGAGRVLGIHLCGPRATDLISEGQLIYNWEALPMDVAQFIHAHPSLGEALGEAHLALAGRPLH